MSNGDQEKEKVGGWDVTQWYSLAYVRPWTPSQHQKRKKKKRKEKVECRHGGLPLQSQHWGGEGRRIANLRTARAAQ
jgi:hypothetical protein